jgi:hypothetical protein
MRQAAAKASKVQSNHTVTHHASPATALSTCPPENYVDWAQAASAAGSAPCVQLYSRQVYCEIGSSAAGWRERGGPAQKGLLSTSGRLLCSSRTASRPADRSWS